MYIIKSLAVAGLMLFLDDIAFSENPCLDNVICCDIWCKYVVDRLKSVKNFNFGLEQKKMYFGSLNIFCIKWTFWKKYLLQPNCNLTPCPTQPRAKVKEQLGSFGQKYRSHFNSTQFCQKSAIFG